MQVEDGYSISPLDGGRYPLPATTDDSDALERFLAQNQGKPVVAVQGLGFVGAVMALVVANSAKRYAVIGVDLPSKASYWRIKSINEGQFPVRSADPKLELYWSQVKRRGNLVATHDPRAFSYADVIVVDVNLDVQKRSAKDGTLNGFDVDLQPFKHAIETIGRQCRPDALVLVETTVPPGTCEQVVWPLLRKCLHDRSLSTERLRLGHSYERVMPGPRYVDSIENFFRVYSGINDDSAQATEEFLRSVIKTDEFPLTRLATTTATEMAKVLENSFRASNIAFIEEWSRFAERAGVNLFEVIQAIRLRPTHRNIMLPGLGVGGYCLTKDPLMASWAFSNLFGSDRGLPRSEAAVAVNDRMPLASFEMTRKAFPRALKGANVLLLGVSYLNDVGDIRSTPVRLLYDALSNEGAGIRLHDPFVTYWEERDRSVESSLDAAFQYELDIVVLTTGHSIYRNNPLLLEHILAQKALLVVDTIGIFDEAEIARISQRHRVRVIGRGDL